MHKIAMEMGKWAMEQAKAHGFDNITSQQWDDLKDCMEIVKCAVCADKDYRIVEVMDEAEEEEKVMGRMGYRGRDPRTGRFVHRSGRGRSAGYVPYYHMMDGMEDYDDMMDYLPNMTGYRMGYSDGRGNNGSSYGSNYSSGNDGSRYGYEGMRNQSRYGESYDRYSDKRRHYHESGDADSKKQMDDSIEDIFNDMENMVQDVIKEMTPEQKAKYKQKMTVLAQKMQ